eukprot:1271747-Rhodomonas_salina.1
MYSHSILQYQTSRLPTSVPVIAATYVGGSLAAAYASSIPDIAQQARSILRLCPSRISHSRRVGTYLVWVGRRHVFRAEVTTSLVAPYARSVPDIAWGLWRRYTVSVPDLAKQMQRKPIFSTGRTESIAPYAM